jgi:hypothetical protein
MPWYDGIIKAVTDAPWSVTATQYRLGESIASVKGTKVSDDSDMYGMSGRKHYFSTSASYDIVLDDTLLIDSVLYKVVDSNVNDDTVVEYTLEIVL